MNETKQFNYVGSGLTVTEDMRLMAEIVIRVAATMKMFNRRRSTADH